MIRTNPTQRLRGALGLALASGTALTLTLTACGAVAQPRPTTTTATAPQSSVPRGLALEAVLAETGLALDEIVVPSDLLAPVRLELRDAQALVALLDVRVLGSAREAHERLASLEPSLSSRGVTTLAGMGDAALADEAHTVLAIARGNVLVVVRAVAEDADVLALGRAVVRAADASPRLDAEGSSRTLARDVVPALQGGRATIALPRGFVAMRVDVEGAGLARRTDDTHWDLERVEDREIVHVTAVDALLRVAR